MNSQVIRLDNIFVDSHWNSRRELTPFDVQSLSANIRANGLIQPLIVRPRRPDENFKEDWALVAGFRRRLACIMAELQEVPCFIREDLDAKAAFMINMSENLNRHDLTILEEAFGCQRLIELGYSKKAICREFGMSEGWLVIRMNLLQLPSDVQEDIVSGAVPVNHVNSLIRLKDNKEALYNGVKKIKEAKARGESASAVTVVKPASKPDTVKIRKPAEIQVLINYLLSISGESLTTVALAWANGNVNNKRLWEKITSLMPNIEPPFDYSIPEVEA